MFLIKKSQHLQDQNQTDMQGLYLTNVFVMQLNGRPSKNIYTSNQADTGLVLLFSGIHSSQIKQYRYYGLTDKHVLFYHSFDLD